MNTGNKIKDKRKRLGISAEFLAEKIGVSPSTIYRYESNDIENMGTDKLKLIADVLNTTASYLMGWEDELQETTYEVNQNKVAEPFSSAEKQLIKIYQQLDEEGKEMVQTIMAHEHDRCILSQDFKHESRRRREAEERAENEKKRADALEASQSEVWDEKSS